MRADKDILNIEQLIDEHYDSMFDWLCKESGDDFHDLVIEVRVGSEGKTVRRSWRERDAMLRDAEAR
jgi:hypothetical protein